MKRFDYEKVKDPQYFRDGRLDAHSDHLYYACEEDCREENSTFTTRYLRVTVCGNFIMRGITGRRSRDLSQRIMTAMTGMISMCRHTSSLRL